LEQLAHQVVPFCGLKQIASDYGTVISQKVKEFLTNDFYMDDGLTGCNTLNKAKALVEGARMACDKGHLRLHKFLSNNDQLMEFIPETERLEASSFEIGQLSDSPLERVLGLRWSVGKD
jgi:hypothetical protein